MRSWPRSLKRSTDEPCTLPVSAPKSGTKCNFAVFDSKIQILSKEVCYKVSLCENVQQQSCSYIIIHPLRTNHGNTPRGRRMVLARSATTLPKLNWFGWNLEHCEPIVGGMALADFWHDARSSDSLRGSRNFVFLVSNTISPISRRTNFRHSNTTRSIGEALKTFEAEFIIYFTIRVRIFKKRKICSQNFLDLRLQAVITPKWLQISGNS